MNAATIQHTQKLLKQLLGVCLVTIAILIGWMAVLESRGSNEVTDQLSSIAKEFNASEVEVSDAARQYSEIAKTQGIDASESDIVDALAAWHPSAEGSGSVNVTTAAAQYLAYRSRGMSHQAVKAQGFIR